MNLLELWFLVPAFVLGVIATIEYWVESEQATAALFTLVTVLVGCAIGYIVSVNNFSILPGA